MLKVKSIMLWAVLTVICLPSSVKGISTVSYRQFKHFDRQRFCAHISSQPWVVFVGVDDPNNEMWLKWKSLFSEVCDRHPPLHTKYIRASNSPWINTEIKKLMFQQDCLKIKASQTNKSS